MVVDGASVSALLNVAAIAAHVLAGRLVGRLETREGEPL